MSYDSDSTASSCGDGTVSIEMGKINDAVDPIVLEPGQSARYVGDFTDRDLKPITTRDLLSWAWQVSRGMKYLSSRRVRKNSRCNNQSSWSLYRRFYVSGDSR